MLKVGDVVTFVAVRARQSSEPARRHNALVTAIRVAADDANGQPIVTLAYLSPHEGDVTGNGRYVLHADHVPWCDNESTLAPLPSGAWPAYYVLRG